MAEKNTLLERTQLCKTFDFPQLVKVATESVDEMSLDLTEIKKVWGVVENLTQFITDSKNLLWKEMNTDELDEGAKAQIKYVKNMHKCVRWCKIYKKADKESKDFAATIPLITLLGAKSMRPRHWEALMKATKKNFVPPYKDDKLLLGGILELNLHEYSADVEDICDQVSDLIFC